MFQALLLVELIWSCYLKLLNDFSIRFPSSITSGNCTSKSPIMLKFYNLVFVEFSFMYFTTIIFGSLRFIADLAFSEHGSLVTKNTLGIFLKGSCLFHFIGYWFCQPHTFSCIYWTHICPLFPGLFHLASPLSWCIFIVKCAADLRVCHLPCRFNTNFMSSLIPFLLCSDWLSSSFVSSPLRRPASSQ